MNPYNVYKHPILGYEAIKQGFSWPGFFFTWIWAFIKKLWLPGIILIPAIFITNTLGFEIAGGRIYEGLVAASLLSLIPMYATGKKGNKWRENSMLLRGYKLESTVMAATPEGALAQAIKPGGKREHISINAKEISEAHQKRKKETISSLAYGINFVLMSVAIFASLFTIGYVIFNVYIDYQKNKESTSQKISISDSIEKKDPALPWTKKGLVTIGKQVYDINCAACHQPNGLGIPGVFPAIAGSFIATRDLAGHIDIVINGKAGTAMQAFGEQLNDVDLAAVITYQRNSLGNSSGDLVQPSDIKAAR